MKFWKNWEVFKLWLLFSLTEDLVPNPMKQCGNSKITKVGKIKIISLSFFFIPHFFNDICLL